MQAPCAYVFLFLRIELDVLFKDLAIPHLFENLSTNLVKVVMSQVLFPTGRKA